MRLEGWHIVIIIVLAIVLFGAPKLPGLARSVGQSLRIFKSEVKQMKDENNTGETGTDPVEGRVVSNPAPQTYTPTSPAPGQPAHQEPPRYQGDGRADSPSSQPGPSQPGPSQQSGSSHTNQ
ncbi:Sec-independent protein translocase subunit TatA [Arthrobacter agilis]|uniref:Sec-independent protein translocase subunit TatA n=1 Tax=Arthrobacter agilis TaxID=37921 RepID=UPI002366F6B7|nr:Sec-independent protein translocase subunit TatA [Arthrobacter agilis]WDF31835.1 Sec-independent protein translocase subunit TatA [Arthrobacter agilis]